jgi:hypothetical protein
LFSLASYRSNVTARYGKQDVKSLITYPELLEVPCRHPMHSLFTMLEPMHLVYTCNILEKTYLFHLLIAKSLASLGTRGNVGKGRGGEGGVPAKIAYACKTWLKSSDSGPVYKQPNCLNSVPQTETEWNESEMPSKTSVIGCVEKHLGLFRNPITDLYWSH